MSTIFYVHDVLSCLHLPVLHGWQECYDIEALGVREVGTPFLLTQPQTNRTPSPTCGDPKVEGLC